MPADVLAHIEKLARQGATIVFIGGMPEDVPGYGDLNTRRNLFNKALNRLASDDNARKGRVILGDDYQKTLALCGVQPEELKTRYGLQFIRRCNDKGHHYFISALQPEGVDNWVTLSVDDTDAMIFDPVSGKKGQAATRRTNDGLQVYLQLQSGESLIVQTFTTPIATDKWAYLQPQTLALSLDHGWTFDFQEINGEQITGGKLFDIDSPRSWTTLNAPHATTMMGTGRYTLSFELQNAPSSVTPDEWILDLGDVRESARVRINGENAGTAWCVPYRLAVGKYLKQGHNTIEIEVTNLPANRIAELDRQQIPWRRFKEINVVDLNYKKTGYGHWEPLPSGLNGQVKLIPMIRKQL